MLLKYPIQNVFSQLSESLGQFTDAEYTQPCVSLFSSTIGQHVRHIIEFFICLENGYDAGIVNYEKRRRDLRIETDKDFSISLLKDIYERLDRPNKDLMMEADTYTDTAVLVSIPSNYYREVAYNLEHSIHHMALIRVGASEVSSILLPIEFGVAYSTIKHKEQSAQ